MNAESSRFVKALHCQPVDRIPVWLMRQAGRYLPEYQKVRQKAGDFLTLCKTPELASEVTLQPIKRFGFDAAIIFSDILTIPDAYGLGLYFEEGEGPKFKHPIRSLSEIQALPSLEIEQDLEYVMKAIEMSCGSLGKNVPLIGFSGSPWTLATYMVEGGSSKQFNHIKKLRYQAPQHLHQLLEKLALDAAAYLKAQIRAGASAVMIFDSWASLLSPQDYLEFSLPYIEKIIQKLNHAAPVIVFAKNGGVQLERLAISGCRAIGLDWTTELHKAKKIIQDLKLDSSIALQGNLDPAALYASPEQIKKSVKRLLMSLEDHQGYIFNLGHGILPDIPLENVYALVEALQEFGSLKMRSLSP